jgi:DNA segregation ATPase FtsK/SpoIIIE-like protein
VGYDEQHKIEAGFQYLRGRLEAQAEFAKAIGVLQIELTERMGSILSSPEALRSLLGFSDSVHDVRLPSSERDQGKRGKVPALAGPREDRVHHGPDDSEEVVPKKKGSSKSYWSSMTPLEVAYSMYHRLKRAKIKGPAQTKQMQTFREKIKALGGDPNVRWLSQKDAKDLGLKPGVQPSSPSPVTKSEPKAEVKKPSYKQTAEYRAKQKSYRDRHKAKEEGKPLPPLPSEQESEVA